jgi:hypothetical protein
MLGGINILPYLEEQLPLHYAEIPAPAQKIPEFSTHLLCFLE